MVRLIVIRLHIFINHWIEYNRFRLWLLNDIKHDKMGNKLNKVCFNRIDLIDNF